MKKILLTFFILLNFNFSFSQEDDGFIYYGTGSGNTEYYYNIEKSQILSYNNKIMDVWIKSVNPIKTVKNKNGKYIKTGGEQTLRLIEFVCDNSTYNIKFVIQYDKNDKVIFEDNDLQFDMQFIPGTVYNELKKTICK
jgi:hypothetical protein